MCGAAGRSGLHSRRGGAHTELPAMLRSRVCSYSDSGGQTAHVQNSAACAAASCCASRPSTHARQLSQYAQRHVFESGAGAAAAASAIYGKTARRTAERLEEIGAHKKERMVVLAADAVEQMAPITLLTLTERRRAAFGRLLWIAPVLVFLLSGRERRLPNHVATCFGERPVCAARSALR